MFRVVISPTIRSAYNCIYSIWYLSHRYCYLPLSWKSWNRFECAVGEVWWVEVPPETCKQFPDINKLCNVASCWIYTYIWNILTMHGPINVKSPNNSNKWQTSFNSTFHGLTIYVHAPTRINNDSNEVHIYIYIYIYIHTDIIMWGVVVQAQLLEWKALIVFHKFIFTTCFDPYWVIFRSYNF
jgi:hypothetical protein